MDPKQMQAFKVDTARTVNLITAALRDCFNWHVENMDDEDVLSPDAVLQQSKLDFAALANFGGKLVMQHTGKRVVFIKVTHPLIGWIPETMFFLVPPDLVPQWKEALTEGIALSAADLLDEWAEIQAEMQIEGDEGGDEGDIPATPEEGSDA